MKVSVIDYGIIDEGSNSQQALQETLLLAQRAEALGYDRFWLAEHHNVPAFALSSPELVLAHLAARTKTIGLGTAGIMALHYSPYKLAETVAMLATLAPNRLTIGWGNSLNTTAVSQALKSQQSAGAFEAVLEQVASYLKVEQSVIAQPRLTNVPPAVTLGMGGTSAEIAGRQGLGYVLGLFPYLFDDPLRVIEASLTRYRQVFVPSVFQPKPYTALAVFVVVAETAEAADRLATATAIWLLGKKDFSEFSHFPSPETADRYAISPEDAEKIAKQKDRLIVGTKETVMEKVKAWAVAGQVDEVILVPVVSGFDNRLKTLTLLQDLLETTSLEGEK